MARTLVESPVTTRASRSGLPNGTHWRGIDTDIHLGYRKSRRGGTWLVRWYTRRDRCYQRISLGVADDVVLEGNLDYAHAVKMAKEAVNKARRKLASDELGPAPTIKVAIEKYLEARNKRLSLREGREMKVSSDSTLNRHVCKNSKFASLRLDELTEADLLKWRKSLGSNLKGTSIRRISNDLKAALNALYKAERKRLPPDLGEIIAFGLNADAVDVEPHEVARENQILDEATVRSIIAEARALDVDLGSIVIVLAATGARFSQLKRMKVRDAQLSLKRLLVPRSLKGRNKVAGFTPVRIGPDVIAVLRRVVDGRSGDEPLLCRWRHVQIGLATWRKDTRGGWQTASEMTRPWNAVCAKLGLVGVVPYALRHTSIVRGIGAGLPIRLVAAMHDTSVAMIEKHYSRWIADGLEELAAQVIKPLISKDI